jgi:hypothetical protein
VEEELRALAGRQGRDVVRLVEDAIRDYIEAAAITDIDEAEVAEVQAKLVGELRGIPAISSQCHANA